MIANWEAISSIATAFAAVAGAMGVFHAAWQFRGQKRIAQASYEESLEQQYREISYGIPVDVLLGSEYDFELEGKGRITKEWIFNYVILSNEQCYLRSENKVTFHTWRAWCSGIEAHLKLPAFLMVWEEVKQKAPESFSYLESLESNRFDPTFRNW